MNCVGHLGKCPTPLEVAQSRLRRIEALARQWATQPTDYDEDTEQQIEDGRAILAIIEGAA